MVIDIACYRSYVWVCVCWMCTVLRAGTICLIYETHWRLFYITTQEKIYPPLAALAEQVLHGRLNLLSSLMWRHIVWYRFTNASDERTDLSSKNKSSKQRCLVLSPTLKIVAVFSAEIPTNFYQITGCRISERCEAHKTNKCYMTPSRVSDRGVHWSESAVTHFVATK
jgi:hypothetical protein